MSISFSLACCFRATEFFFSHRQLRGKKGGRQVHTTYRMSGSQPTSWRCFEYSTSLNWLFLFCCQVSLSVFTFFYLQPVPLSRTPQNLISPVFHPFLQQHSFMTATDGDSVCMCSVLSVCTSELCAVIGHIHKTTKKSGVIFSKAAAGPRSTTSVQQQYVKKNSSSTAAAAQRQPCFKLSSLCLSRSVYVCGWCTAGGDRTTTTTSPPPTQQGNKHLRTSHQVNKAYSIRVFAKVRF